MDADLFDYGARQAEALAAKAAGMKQVEDNADTRWNVLMFRLVRIVAEEVPEFTSDDVIDRYEAQPGAVPTTHDLRAFGPVMRRAARAGICRNTYRTVPSRRKSLHASPRAVWQSLIYKGK